MKRMSTRAFREAFPQAEEPIEVLRGVETIGRYYPDGMEPKRDLLAEVAAAQHYGEHGMLIGPADLAGSPKEVIVDDAPGRPRIRVKVSDAAGPVRAPKVTPEVFAARKAEMLKRRDEDGQSPEARMARTAAPNAFLGRGGAVPKPGAKK